MPKPSTTRLVAAGTIGNVLEWYDFAIYGYFAPSIGRAFFPSEDAVAQVLAAFGVFAVGYLMRPVGGAVVGYIGDRYGRRIALIFSVTAMAVPTFLVGLLPGYATLGIAAPVLLTLLRTIQGLSVGGEWTTAYVFLVEHAPKHRRGLMGAAADSAGAVGVLLGSAMGTLMSSVMPAATLDAWGWRLPFLLGILAGIAGLQLRLGVGEPPATAEDRARSPLAETVRHHGGLVARIAGVCAFCAVGFYLMFLYVVSWLQTVDGVPPDRALAINTAALAVMIPFELFAGWLSDRVGRRPVLLGALVFGFVSALPLLWLMHSSNSWSVILGQMGFVISVGAVLAVQPSWMVEVTPPAVRCTTMALGYNISLGVLGGLTPMAATWLVYRTGMDLSPAFMIMAVAAISFAAILSFSTRKPALAQ